MVHITSLELENVKRVAALTLHCNAQGLTVIGGGNAQGKTSVLDAIAYALGGERRRPSNLQRDGAIADARIHITLSNGLTVERKGKNAALTVTDPTGAKSGQRLLDSFIEELALDLPKFLAMPDKGKADVLLRTLGIGEQLDELEKREKAMYDERRALGQIADQKTKYAAEMPEWHDVPEDLQTPAELVSRSQAIMQRNALRDHARANVRQALATVESRLRRVNELQAALDQARTELAEAEGDVRQAQAEPIPDNESTAEVEAMLADMESVNAQIRQNADKRRALEDAENAVATATEKTVELEGVRGERAALLDGAQMPLPELTVSAGALVYRGQAWDCMSSSEQMRVATAIVRKLRPECGFVLLDGLERFDADQLAEFGKWLEAEGIQAIATRVSTGAECTIVIEDGLAKQATTKAMPAGIDW